MTSPQAPGRPSWLPQSTGQRTSPLEIVGYDRAVMRSLPADVNGQATVEFITLDYLTAWLVDVVLMQAGSLKTCRGFLWENDTQIGNILAVTGDGRFDINETRQPLFIPPGSKLIAGWSGLLPGVVGLARVQYRVLKVSD